MLPLRGGRKAKQPLSSQPAPVAETSNDPAPIEAATLQSLPDELKVTIFQHVLVSDWPVLPGVEAPFYGRPSQVVALLRVNKAFHSIAAEIFYSENLFAFDCRFHLQDFIEQINQNRNLVQHVSFGSIRHEGWRRTPVDITCITQLQRFAALKNLELMSGLFSPPNAFDDVLFEAEDIVWGSFRDIDFARLFSTFPNLQVKQHYRCSEYSTESGLFSFRYAICKCGESHAEFKLRWQVAYDQATDTVDLSLLDRQQAPCLALGDSSLIDWRTDGYMRCYGGYEAGPLGSTRKPLAAQLNSW